MKRKPILIVLLTFLATLCLVGMLLYRLPDPTDPTVPTGEPALSASTGQAQETTEPAEPSTAMPTTEPTTAPTTEPTEPPVVREATATVGVTGDILLHDLVIRSGYDEDTDTFDFNYIFEYFSRYASAVDYAVANLEVTLIQKPGSDGLKGYNGYPRFNAPDEIVDALKEAGFDMLLTANNHSYDSGHDGLIRTPQVIAEKGLDSIGTYTSTEEPRYKIVEVNGIRIGMINYTYDTGDYLSKGTGATSLNGIYLTVEDTSLINHFNYNELDAFYALLQTQLDAMRAEGAEAIVLYIHWGDEYDTTPNSKQKKMAQQLCNMGIDVIVGNHAHVPQPVELLTDSNDSGRKTLCLYSTGNAVSNIYGNASHPSNTEDGMLFTFTFVKYSDGTVALESTDILPTWCWRYKDENSVWKYVMLTLDDGISNWQTALGISDSVLSKCQESYERTFGIVGGGLETANAWFAVNIEALETQLGVCP